MARVRYMLRENGVCWARVSILSKGLTARHPAEASDSEAERLTTRPDQCA